MNTVEPEKQSPPHERRAGCLVPNSEDVVHQRWLLDALGIPVCLLMMGKDGRIDCTGDATEFFRLGSCLHPTPDLPPLRVGETRTIGFPCLPPDHPWVSRIPPSIIERCGGLEKIREVLISQLPGRGPKESYVRTTDGVHIDCEAEDVRALVEQFVPDLGAQSLRIFPSGERPTVPWHRIETGRETL